jgi:hypothetical protein
MSENEKGSDSDKKPEEKGEDETKISDGQRAFGIVAGIVVGAVLGAIAAALGTMGAEMLQYAGTVPSPTTGGVLGAVVGGLLGLAFPAKAASLLVDLI